MSLYLINPAVLEFLNVFFQIIWSYRNYPCLFSAFLKLIILVVQKMTLLNKPRLQFCCLGTPLRCFGIFLAWQPSTFDWCGAWKSGHFKAWNTIVVRPCRHLYQGIKSKKSTNLLYNLSIDQFLMHMARASYLYQKLLYIV